MNYYMPTTDKLVQTYRQLAGEVLLQEYHPGEWRGKYPVGH